MALPIPIISFVILWTTAPVPPFYLKLTSRGKDRRGSFARQAVADFPQGQGVDPLDARVPIDASLKTAFAEMLQHDAGWVAVLDKERFLGVLTPDALHAALRRSVGGDPVPVQA